MEVWIDEQFSIHMGAFLTSALPNTISLKIYLHQIWGTRELEVYPKKNGHFSLQFQHKDLEI